MTSAMPSGLVWATRCFCVSACSRRAALPSPYLTPIKAGKECSYGLCQCPEGLNQSKNQSAVQSHEKTAHLLRLRRADRRTAFLFAQRQYRHQSCRHGDDGGNDIRPCLFDYKELIACYLKQHLQQWCQKQVRCNHIATKILARKKHLINWPHQYKHE